MEALNVMVVERKRNEHFGPAARALIEAVVLEAKHAANLLADRLEAGCVPPSSKDRKEQPNRRIPPTNALSTTALAGLKF